MKNETFDSVYASQLATRFAKGGIPTASAKELGKYLAWMEKRVDVLEKKQADLEKKLDEGQPGINIK